MRYFASHDLRICEAHNLAGATFCEAPVLRQKSDRRWFFGERPIASLLGQYLSCPASLSYA
jgi:hypothetical protein